MGQYLRLGNPKDLVVLFVDEFGILYAIIPLPRANDVTPWNSTSSIPGPEQSPEACHA